MLFFSKKNPAIVYLQKDRLFLYSDKHPDGLLFEFPKNALKNHLVVHRDILSDNLQTFIAENNILNGDLVVVLGDEVFTQKKIESQDRDDQQKEVNQFLKSVDIPSGYLTKETFELDNAIYILATDKRFYKEIISLFKELNWQIASIVPISLFRNISDSKIKKDGLNQKEIEEIRKNKQLVQEANLLSEQDPQEEQEEKQEEAQEKSDSPTKEPNEKTPPRSGNGKTIIIIVGILLLIVGGSVFLYSQGSFTPLLEKVQPEPTPTPTPQATPTPTQAPVEKDKSKLTVQILNGTGTPGQAARVKIRLTNLDYTDIKTANSDTEDNTETKIVFSSKVSKEYQEEIIEDLEKIFTTVKNEVSEDTEFDIDILTGTETEDNE